MYFKYCNTTNNFNTFNTANTANTANTTNTANILNFYVDLVFFWNIFPPTLDPWTQCPNPVSNIPSIINSDLGCHLRKSPSSAWIGNPQPACAVSWVEFISRLSHPWYIVVTCIPLH